MYLSQTMITLVLLLFLTGTLVYQTIDLHKEAVLNEMKASDVDLKSSAVEHVVNNALPKIFNKALNDAELYVIERYNNGERNPFFDNTSDALKFIEERAETLTILYLNNVSEKYSKMGYGLDYIFDIKNITMVDGFTFKVDYVFSYDITKDGIYKIRNINNTTYVTVKTLVDAYHYINSIQSDKNKKKGSKGNTTLLYISPSTFVEDNNSPSIVDMLANNTNLTWGYGIKPMR
ncbi:hypothetical protein [Methanotorris formicicus]|uniref:Uncharacterized protein n=1 Tax=Methanotorris formicicus Mc-S-70 TaxID=647171 RepID=H1KYZ1_9EURY|nr:hypothetical protein [Methanotorris formicicus]EHP86571.1 hypothetical protein MetfoDRAFT_1011 [Methanotorris formicicus Mc-S-70]